MEKQYRPELPVMPDRIAELPVYRGYPVPWFVAWVREEGSSIPVPVGQGVAEFRVMREDAPRVAWFDHLCWICGQSLSSATRTYAIGPMCAVNRVSSEPPSHFDCAEWSARACPFLTRPHMVRRDARLPEEASRPAGVMIDRNPGVTLLWKPVLGTDRAVNFGGDGKLLFRVGEPDLVAWFCEGRAATRKEVLDSINSGYPALLEIAELQGPLAVAQLGHQRERVAPLLPRQSA